MSDQAHDRWSDDLAAWLLGALTEDECAEFERHLAGCERCRDDAASLRPVVDMLPVGAPPVAAPSEVKARVMRVVDSEAELMRAAGSEADRPPSARRRGLRGLFPRPAITAAAAAAALAVGVLGGIVLVDGGGGGPGERTVAARVILPAAPAASASVRVRGERATLVVRGMPVPEEGRVYQVWIRRGANAPVPAGALFELRSGAVAIPRPVRRGDQVLVTSERDGGSSAPTRAPFVVAAPV